MLQRGRGGRPASSASHAQMAFALCPSANAALMSGQGARIRLALVAGFFAGGRVRRVRACLAQWAEVTGSSPPDTHPLGKKGGRAQQALCAYADALAKALPTCVPEPPAGRGREPSHVPKSPTKGYGWRIQAGNGRLIGDLDRP